MNKSVQARKENMYSRQIGTYGTEIMKKLMKLRILIIGLRGLGIETAKNIILSGPEKVFIFDPKIITITDLGSNYYLKKKDVGIKRRDESSFEELLKLNPYTSVEHLKNYENFSQLIKNILELKLNVVIITEIYPLDKIKLIDSICRKNKIIFIYGLVFGLNSFIFSDFGKEHYIFDKNGKDTSSYFCTNITNEKNPLVTINSDISKLSIRDDDYVIFKELNGMQELNNNIPKRIKFNDYKSFYLIDEDSTNYSKYINGGKIYQVKLPIKKNYKSFEESIKYILDLEDLNDLENICEDNGISLEEQLLLLISILSIHEFFEKNNEELPILNDEESSKKIVSNCKEIYDKIISKLKNKDDENFKEFKENFVLKISEWSRGEIPPLCSIIGGFLAQEIIKAAGKYEPINQFMLFDFFNSFIKEKTLNKKEKSDNYNSCRYEEQLSIFGEEVQNKLEKLNIFLVGSGAIGCEILKLFALMGISTKKKENDTESVVTVTDNDNIEVSNLNRQFLFRNENVGQPKSKIACINAKKINSDFNCYAYQQKVCDETENIFNQKFWINQDIIVSAVDNIEARKYIDEKCTKYEKILINSGTLGTEGKTELVIPHKTCCLNEIIGEENNEEKIIIPMCSLRNLPSNIDHCIELSKDFFNDLFVNYINELNLFITEKDKNIFNGNDENLIQKYYIIKNYIDFIVNKNGKNLEKNLINLIMYLLYVHFIKNIEIILKNHPLDSIEDGVKFWSGTRIPPKPLPEIKYNNKMISQFLICFINIISKIFGISFKMDLIFENFFEKKLTNDYINNLFPDLNKEEILQKNNEFKNLLNNYIITGEEINLNPEIFDKDNSEINYHVYFIQSYANLKARIFNIEEIDYNKTLMKAGNIIAAVPTSTSAVAGFLCLQIYNLLQTNEIEHLKDSIMDLSSKELITINPLPPSYIENTIEPLVNKFTVWDKINLNGNKTCQDIIDFILEKYNINVNYIDVNGKVILTNRRIKDPKMLKIRKNIMGQKIEEVYYKRLIDNEGKNPEIIRNEQYLFVQIYGKYKNEQINYFPLIKYYIR